MKDQSTTLGLKIIQCWYFGTASPRRKSAAMAQLEFRLYKVDENDRPSIKWLDDPPLPLSDVKAAAKAVGINLQPNSYSVGIIKADWHAHQSGCLVVAESPELSIGEWFAVSLEPV
jgi:hypothetical protein